MKINYCENPKIKLGEGVEEKIEDSVLDLFFDRDKDYMEAFENRGYQILFHLESRIESKENEMDYLPVLEIMKGSEIKGGRNRVARKAYLYSWLTTKEEDGVVIIEKRQKPIHSLEKD